MRYICRNWKGILRNVGEVCLVTYAVTYAVQGTLFNVSRLIVLFPSIPVPLRSVPIRYDHLYQRTAYHTPFPFKCFQPNPKPPDIHNSPVRLQWVAITWIMPGSAPQVKLQPYEGNPNDPVCQWYVCSHRHLSYPPYISWGFQLQTGNTWADHTALCQLTGWSSKGWSYRARSTFGRSLSDWRELARAEQTT